MTAISLFESAEIFVWERLDFLGISEETSDTGTVENILADGFTLADFGTGRVNAHVIDRNISWLD